MPAPPSRTSPRTGTARSAARARLTSHPSRVSLSGVTAVESRGAARGVAPLEALVFAVGFSSLGAEIAAARLMAPFFGASTVIWANTIAVVLLALAVGYWVGGRLADRHPRGTVLCAVVLAAAALLACVPLAAAPLLGGTQDALSE